MKLAYTIKEAVDATGIGQSAIYEELTTGRLAAKKRGGTTLIEADELKAFIARLPDWKPAAERT
jgi:excisionase family DNA binding protein